MRFLIAALLFSACQRDPVPSWVLMGEDEYPVLAAAIEKIATHRHDKPPWVVHAMTIDMEAGELLEPTVRSLRRELPAIEIGTARDYLVQNAQSSALSEAKLTAAIHVANKEELNALRRRARWPDTFGVSRPGFNAARTQAVVFVDYSCGGLCGMGFRLLLARREGVWVVIEQKPLWTS